VDFHFQGFKALGAEVVEEHGVMKARASRLRGGQIHLNPRFCSVGATVNIMMAATLASGTTVIENASREPEVVDCAKFMVKAGADITGIGTPQLVIRGVDELHGCCHSVIPDRMEAGTFLIAGAATGGDVTVLGAEPRHLETVIATLRQAGFYIEVLESAVRLIASRRPRSFDVMTAPYPGFATDLHPQTVVLMAIASGRSIMEETIYDGRFNYMDELRRMGANIRVFGQTAVVDGVSALSNAPVEAADLRAGAALVIAGLVADGETEIVGAEHLDRGYERIEEKFATLGATLRRAGTDGTRRRIRTA